MPVSPVSSNQSQETKQSAQINDFTNAKAGLVVVINHQVNKIKTLEEQLTKSRGKSCKICQENKLLAHNNLPSHEQILHPPKKVCVRCLVGYGILAAVFLSFLVKAIRGKKSGKKH
ncbi:MAG: hypothetical protein NY202_00705 [Mollicutes bacterium UO1]